MRTPIFQEKKISYQEKNISNISNMKIHQQMRQSRIVRSIFFPPFLTQLISNQHNLQANKAIDLRLLHAADFKTI